MDVPGPRSERERSVGFPVPLSAILPKPIHYVMAGGGSHGAVQWGALQALALTDIVPDSILGTSAGALTGSIMSEDLKAGVARLAYVWGQMNMSYLAGERWWTRGLSQMRSPGLVNNTVEQATINAILHTELIEDLDVAFGAVATDLASGQPHVFDSGPIVPALLASSAIPGVLPPVEIDGRLYCDGLASANLPAIQAVQRGAGSIIVLDTGHAKSADVGTSSAKVLNRVRGIMAMSQRRRQLRDAAARVPVVLLPTPDDLGGTLDFGDTMHAGSTTYQKARAFLVDLFLQGHDTLGAGLYARPDDPGLSHDLLPLLQEVPG